MAEAVLADAGLRMPRHGDPSTSSAIPMAAPSLLRLAMQQPERLLSLVLIEPVAFHLLREEAPSPANRDLFGEVMEVAALVSGAAASGDYRHAMARFVDYWNGEGAWLRAKPELQAALARHTPKVALDFWAAMTESTPRAAYERIAVPTLILSRRALPAADPAHRRAAGGKPAGQPPADHRRGGPHAPPHPQGRGQRRRPGASPAQQGGPASPGRRLDPSSISTQHVKGNDAMTKSKNAQNSRPPWRDLPQRSGDRIGGGADLPDDLLPVPRDRACGESLRPQGARQHLYPHHEPDHRCAGAAHRRPRRRRGGAGRQLRPGGLGHGGAEHRPGRRQYRQLHRSLRRHLESLRQHLPDHGHRGALRRSRRSGGLPPRHRCQHPRLLRGDPAQSEARPSSPSRRWRPSGRSWACR